MEETKKKGKMSEATLEIIIAVFLSITALLTAWSSWVGGLHGSNQASNYAESNNLQTEGNSEWNEDAQNLVQDMLLWNDISDLQLEYMYYTDDDPEKALAAYQLYYKCFDNLTDEMAAKIGWDFDAAAAVSDPEDYIAEWVQKEEATVTPFSDSEFVESYFTEAQEKIDKAAQLLKDGNEDNANADKYGLVSVFFSLVLFLLGIAGTFKNLPNRKVVVVIGLVILVIGIAYMLWVPMPRGFSMANYFTK